MEPSVAPKAAAEERRGFLGSIWVQAALVVAVVESILVVVGVIPRWVAVVISIAVIAAYFAWGRNLTGTSRQGAWAVTLSQAVVLFVPLILWILGATLVVIAAIVAVVVLVVLFADR